MADDTDLPWIENTDITPNIEKLVNRIIGWSDRGELTPSLLERALVAYTRAIDARE